ncbi:MAG: FtsW/RodA/SpoVE family cell cycle protein, partial [Chloroflexota bacterium]|nr:FtsW/RodA/SpoVE family cell cycle protein [Chloroflexota bacterium]
FYFAVMALLAIPGLWVAWRFLFRDYQKERLLVSYDPGLDPFGAGFNIIQARISIGSGGWFGFGLHGGSQSQADLLRVRESDFIFAHASGMVGYLGMLALFVSFIILLWRCVGVVDAARDSFGQLLAIGISGILFFQAVVNIGMNVGLMPVTGITLPFISDGVSSLWSFLFAEGILQSILMHKRKLAFQRG